MIIMKGRPPRLYTDAKGRYVKIDGQKVYINSPINNKQLVKVIINNFRKHKKSKKNKKRIKKKVDIPKQLEGTTLDNSSGELARNIILSSNESKR